MMNNEVPDFHLIRQVCNGQKECFTLIYDRYSFRLMRYLGTMLRDQELIADVAQDVWVKVFQNVKKYRPGGSFVSWLFTIARNTTIDFIRKSKGKPTALQSLLPEAELIETFPANNPGPHEVFKDEPECLRSLSPLMREVLLLRVVEELPYKEISEITGLSADRLRRIVFDAKRLIREV